MQRQLKPDTLNALKGNNLTAENRWLAECIEDCSMLCFEFDADSSMDGTLIGMSAYHYLVLAKRPLIDATSPEQVINKARVRRIYRVK